MLIGGGGQDVLDGGTGNNVVIQRGRARCAAAMLLNQAMAANFVPAGDGHGEMPLPDPHAAQSQTLAPPQHA